MAAPSCSPSQQASQTNTCMSSVETSPTLTTEVHRVETDAERLSLGSADGCCERCGQRLRSKPSFLSSCQSINLDEHSQDPVCQGDCEEPIEDVAGPPRGLRFWSIMLSLIVVGIISALETTIVGTALPTIVAELGDAEWYIWTVNGYLLTSMVFQPLYGQLANIFGRRNVMILSIVLFLFGCAICGGARSMEMLIAGRAIQGAGGGPMAMLGHLILSDIVPLRERASFMSIVYIAILVGTGIGPFVGGAIVQHTSWRWIFLLNLPIGGFALLLVILFLQVGHNNDVPVKAKLKQIDYIGNAIFIPSVVAILLALTYGGTTQPWSSWNVVFPLVTGFIGLGAFAAYEWSKYCIEPTMPARLFKNRTTVAALALSFITYMMLYWVVYYLPVYFQSVQGSSPTRSGVQILPFVLVMIPIAAIAGRLLAKIGRYRVLHTAAFVFMGTGFGLMTTLVSTTSTAGWVCYQILVALGVGILMSTLLPAVQAPLDECDTAAVTSTWGFFRSFGMLWGAAIPAAIFNNRINQLADRISDPIVRRLLSGGRAYQYATASFVESYQGEVKGEVIGVYADSLKLVWQIAIGIAGLGFVLVFAEKEVILRTNLETDYGIEEEKTKKGMGSSNCSTDV